MGRLGVILVIILIVLFIVNRFLIRFRKNLSGKKKPEQNLRQKKSSGIDRSKIVDAEFEEVK